MFEMIVLAIFFMLIFIMITVITDCLNLRILIDIIIVSPAMSSVFHLLLIVPVNILNGEGSVTDIMMGIFTPNVLIFLGITILTLIYIMFRNIKANTYPYY
ncbi:MAG: hypothetical protein K0R54_782 [Clostridiaceae bacterium]|jgi:hypothetical protein|nr:hypothetical protein [Clostridiaceae bacterium]